MPARSRDPQGMALHPKHARHAPIAARRERKAVPKGRIDNLGTKGRTQMELFLAGPESASVRRVRIALGNDEMGPLD